MQAYRSFYWASRSCWSCLLAPKSVIRRPSIPMSTCLSPEGEGGRRQLVITAVLWTHVRTWPLTCLVNTCPNLAIRSLAIGSLAIGVLMACTRDKTPRGIFIFTRWDHKGHYPDVNSCPCRQLVNIKKGGIIL